MKNLKAHIYKVYGAETLKELRVVVIVHLIVAFVVATTVTSIFKALGWCA
jgi:hypothetical protein